MSDKDEKGIDSLADILKRGPAPPAGAADDLKKITGVGPVLEKKLNALGVTRFDQVANFSDEDIAKVDDALNFKGRIMRDDWIGQAKTLAGG